MKEGSKEWLEEMITREEQELDYHRDRLYNFKEQLRDLSRPSCSENHRKQNDE